MLLLCVNVRDCARAPPNVYVINEMHGTLDSLNGVSGGIIWTPVACSVYSMEVHTGASVCLCVCVFFLGLQNIYNPHLRERGRIPDHCD